MEFRLLGPLEVVDGDRRIPLGGARQRALLALLLTRSNEVVSVDRLIDQLWGGSPPRTAANTIQFYISRLRRVLGNDRIVTRAPGYLIVVEPSELDLERFEALVSRGNAESLRDALALWRGQALADIAYEPFAQHEIQRLEELRILAFERRIECDLSDGRHAELVGEIERLVVEYPLRERLRALQMRALYGAGRQADALAAYQAARVLLVGELGLEPSAALQDLERQILQHDPSLLPASAPGSPSSSERAILVIVEDESSLVDLLAVAAPLARRPSREIVLIELVADAANLSHASEVLLQRRAELQASGLTTRAAAFTSETVDEDVARLAVQQDVDLVLVDAPRGVDGDGWLTPPVDAILQRAPCDVALLLRGGDAQPDACHAVLVPFGGSDDDWAAVELAAWVAASTEAPLRLLGAQSDGSARDASRLLANASLLVQRAIGISTEPLLVTRGPTAVVSAADGAGLVVMGLPARWRETGVGPTRAAIARDAEPAVLLVRAGLRPGGVAPAETLTRFSWTLGTR